MPSHRKQRVPRHRAQRRIEDPGRRAALNAVLAAPKLAREASQRASETALQALSAPEHAEPGRAEAGAAEEVPEATLIGPILGGPAFDPAAAGRSSAGSSHRLYSAVRGLLVTPWFAASTGFVVAAGMWLYSPHASINFPPAIGKVPCELQGCVTPGGRGPGSLTSSAPGQKLVPKHHGRNAYQTGAGTSVSGLKITFTALWQGHDSFGAMVTISARRSLGHWHLAFRLPGTQIQDVFGAAWVQSARPDAGTAGPFDGAYGRPADDGGISFQVLGNGTVSKPTGCVFDGVACTFTVTSGRHDHHHGGDGPGGGGTGQSGYSGYFADGRQSWNVR